MKRDWYDYRILEYRGEFIIQTKYIESSGILWWKKQKTVWRNIDICGNPMIYSSFLPLPPMDRGYSSKKKAEKALRNIIKGTIVHYAEQV